MQFPGHETTSDPIRRRTQPLPVFVPPALGLGLQDCLPINLPLISTSELSDLDIAQLFKKLKLHSKWLNLDFKANAILGANLGSPLTKAWLHPSILDAVASSSMCS